MNFRKLKIIAVLAMLSDHVFCQPPLNLRHKTAMAVADFLVTNPDTQSQLYDNIISLIKLPFGIIGRMAAVLFFFFIANGYIHTKNIKKYIIRLCVFGAISQIPYTLFSEGNLVPLSDMRFNILFSLALGLFSIWCFEKLKGKNILLAVISISAICIFSYIVDIEYSYQAILFILFFYYTQNLPKGKKAILGLAVVIALNLPFTIKMIKWGITEPYYLSTVIRTTSIYLIGNYLAILLTFLYNGKKGNTTNFSKYFYYVFYPAHMLILAFIQIHMSLA